MTLIYFMTVFIIAPHRFDQIVPGISKVLKIVT